jgi:hypothetical protein
MCTIEEPILQRAEAYEKGIAKHTYQVGDLVFVQNYQIADSLGTPGILVGKDRSEFGILPGNARLIWQMLPDFD